MCSGTLVGFESNWGGNLNDGLGPEHPYGTLVRTAKVLGKDFFSSAGLTPGYDTCLQAVSALPPVYAAATIADNTYSCPVAMDFVMSEEECRFAATQPGFDGFEHANSNSGWPAGCFVYLPNKKSYFNSNTAPTRFVSNHVRMCGPRGQTIRVKSKPEYCLNAAGGGLNSGDEIILHSCSAAPNEQFVYRTSDSTIRVKSKPEYCLNVRGGDLVNGDKIIIFSCSANYNEQFVLVFD